MSSFRYDVLKALSHCAPKLVTPSAKPGVKTFSVVVVEHVTHRARVEAADETGAWQQFILGRFVERFRQVRSEMSDVVIKRRVRLEGRILHGEGFARARALLVRNGHS